MHSVFEPATRRVRCSDRLIPTAISRSRWKGSSAAGRSGSPWDSGSEVSSVDRKEEDGLQESGKPWKFSLLRRICGPLTLQTERFRSLVLSERENVIRRVG